jgi:hypothetical protein
MHASSSALTSQRPSHLLESEKAKFMFALGTKPRHSLTLSLAHPSESKDSRVSDALESKSSMCAHTSESKDSFVNSGIPASKSPLPTIEGKSDTVSELNLFAFPEEGRMTVGTTSSHSPLLSPARMNSSSCGRENQDVKQEPLEVPNNTLDPNDEFDLRNGILKPGADTDYLPSSSGSERITKLAERKIITEEDVQTLLNKRPTVGRPRMTS